MQISSITFRKCLSITTLTTMTITSALAIIAISSNTILSNTQAWNCLSLVLYSSFIHAVIKNKAKKKGVNHSIPEEFNKNSKENNIRKLGNEITVLVLGYLQYDEIVTLRRTCRFLTKDNFRIPAAKALGLDATCPTVQISIDFEHTFLHSTVSALTSAIKSSEYKKNRKYKNVTKEIVSWRTLSSPKLFHLFSLNCFAFQNLVKIVPYLQKSGLKQETKPYKILTDYRVVFEKSWLNRNWSLANLLIKYHPDVNDLVSNNLSAIHYSIKIGQEQLLSLLLQAGATVDTFDKNEGTPLVQACKLNNLPAVTMLLNFKADVNATHHFYQRSALMLAVTRHHKNIVSRLLEAKAHVNHRDLYGDTAYMLADDPSIQKLLSEAGADTNITPIHS